jgi:hypothetical protein
MASTLNPPMFDMYLPSALTSHFEQRVQQGLIYRNLQSTQNVLAFLATLQGLGDQDHHTAEYDRRDTSRSHLREQDNARDWETGNCAPVPYVRQGDTLNRTYSDRGQQGEGGRSFHRCGQGSLREDSSSKLNPIALNFHPRNNVPPRSLSAETTDSSPPPLAK